MPHLWRGCDGSCRLTMTSRTSVHCRNALAAGAASLLVLLGITLWMGSWQDFPETVSGGVGLLLMISLGAVVLGAFLSARRIWWGILVGALFGLAVGTAIVLHGLSQI